MTLGLPFEVEKDFNKQKLDNPGDAVKQVRGETA